MPTPVSIFMYVQPGTLTPVPPKCALAEDPNRPTPLLTLMSVVDNATSDHGTYSTTACQAVAGIIATEWATMCALIADHTHQVKVDITYDNSVSGTNKPLIGGPRFSAVPLLAPGLLGHIASAVHAAEERVESGVSSELREDIRHTKAAVDGITLALDGIKTTLDSIKAKVDKL